MGISKNGNGYSWDICIDVYRCKYIYICIYIHIYIYYNGTEFSKAERTPSDEGHLS